MLPCTTHLNNIYVEVYKRSKWWWMKGFPSFLSILGYRLGKLGSFYNIASLL